MGISADLGSNREPSRSLVAAADWSNILAGLTLIVPFAILVGTSTFNWFEMTQLLELIFQICMAVEGFLWALGGALTAWTFVIRNDDAYGAVSQTVITFGGIFFFLNGLYNGIPGKAISFGYVLDPHGRVQFTDSAPYYGTACFMTGTAMGLRNSWSLSRKRFLSVFWASFCMCLGAWTLGMAIWVPMLFDGFASYKSFDNPDVKMYSQKTFAWSSNHLFQICGACTLTVGAFVFATIDGVLWWYPISETKTSSKQSPDEDLENK